MTISFWQRAEMGPDVTCDVAVVGGGIIGTSTAYWLKRLHPTLNVALLDAHTFGFGATGRNAGFLLQGAAVDFATDIERYGLKNAALLWDFTLENRNLIAAEFDAARIQFAPTGSVLLAGDSVEAERLHVSAAKLSDSGQSVSYWNAKEVTSKTRGIGYEGGLYIGSGASLNSQRLLREIAGKSGAQLLEYHPVHDIQPEGEHIALYTPRRKVRANQVILALNAYLPQLLPENATLVRPVRAQMFATNPLKSWLAYPVYSHEGYYYLRQLSGGELLMGGARHLHTSTEIGYDDATTSPLQDDLLAYLLQHYPHLNQTVDASFVSQRWSGTMGFTPDGLPVIGEAQGMKGCIWAAGFNGHGMGYGFRFGKLLAQIHGGLYQNDRYARMFSIDRFGAT